MARRLPPLNALRAFEAGGRHLSFTRAAAELHVTQAAVSHQVKALEAHLGVRLFRRMTRRLALTEAGRELLPKVGAAFDRIAEAAERAGGPDGDRTLTVSLTASFGARWLVQRLGRFWARHPEIDLKLHHTIHLVDLRREEADVAVRWGRGSWPGLEAEFLIRAGFTPVCSPALLSGPHPLRRPADLRNHTLLHEEDYEDWTQWLTAAGVDGVDPRRGPMIDDPSVLDRATLDGQGVALGRTDLIAEHLAAGRLVRPFDLDLDTDYAYYVVYPPKSLERPKVKAFRDFVLAEAAAERVPLARPGR
jgi:LysR family glycine cleavage system transcriptional activator